MLGDDERLSKSNSPRYLSDTLAVQPLIAVLTAGQGGEDAATLQR